MSPQEFWTLADEFKPAGMIGKMRMDSFEELVAELHSEEPSHA